MAPIDKVRKFSNPMLILFVASKAVIGVGIGLILAQYIARFGLWILLIGIALSIPGWLEALKK